MLTRMLAGAVATASLILLVGAGTAVAQARPSLSGLEGQVDQLGTEQSRILDALCAHAEATGDGSFRPYACDPTCACHASDPLGSAAGLTVTCTEETSPVQRVVLTGTRDFGTCSGGGLCQSNNTCQGEGSGDPCSLPNTCSAGEICRNLGGFGYFCVVGCTTDADCTSNAVCAASSRTACNTSADCPEDETCEGVNPTCVNTCFSDAGCVVNHTTVYSGPVGIDSPDPVTCTGAGPSVDQNGNDTLACLALAESFYGTTCSYLCGNGLVQPGEQCDDGNTTPGDGCSASCQLEP